MEKIFEIVSNIISFNDVRDDFCLLNLRIIVIHFDSIRRTIKNNVKTGLNYLI